MAWEWVAPVVTGVVGVAGTTGTVVVAWLGRRHAEEVARTNARTSIFSAREARATEFFVDAVHVVSQRTLAILKPGYDCDELQKAMARDEQHQQRVGAQLTLFGNSALAYVHVRHLLTSVELITMIRAGETESQDFNRRIEDLIELEGRFAILAKRQLGRDPFAPPSDHDEEMKMKMATAELDLHRRARARRVDLLDEDPQ